MADSPRKIYLGAIADCLRRIQRADGYNTDAGATVTLEPTPKVATDDAFIAVVWARQARASESARARTARDTNVQVIAKVPAKYDDAQDRVDAIVTDIERAFADQQFRFPDGYQFPQYQSAEPLAAAAADGWVGVIVTVSGLIPIH